MPTHSDDPGALESMIGGEGIKDQWRNLLSAKHAPLPTEINATEIFDRALDGDGCAQTLLDQTATMLAQAIYNISLVLNCPLFVLGGAVGLHPGLCDATQALLGRWIGPGCPRMVRSTLGTDAQLLGTLRAALDSARNCAKSK